MTSTSTHRNSTSRRMWSMWTKVVPSIKSSKWKPTTPIVRQSMATFAATTFSTKINRLPSTTKVFIPIFFLYIRFNVYANTQLPSGLVNFVSPTSLLFFKRGKEWNTKKKTLGAFSIRLSVVAMYTQNTEKESLGNPSKIPSTLCITTLCKRTFGYYHWTHSTFPFFTEDSSSYSVYYRSVEISKCLHSSICYEMDGLITSH